MNLGQEFDKSVLERNPNVGFKIEDSDKGPRVILFTANLGTKVEECIDVAMNVATEHLKARRRGMEVNTNILINYKGVCFSINPRMTVEEGLDAYRKAKHKHHHGNKFSVVDPDKPEQG